MREIKFRGFAVAEMVNSQWLTGFGVYPIEFSKEYAERTGRKKEIYLYTEGGNYQVQEKSIGQYTGLKDKNGVEIYEGDVVKWFSRFGVEVGKIEFARHGFHVVLESTYMYRIDEFQCEVIGNIYENPELLEAKKSS